MMYASYSEGFKGGGWNSHFNQPPPPAAFLARCRSSSPRRRRPTRSGSSSTWRAIRLRLNVAVFSTDYKDLQVTYRGPDAAAAVSASRRS